MVRLLEPEGLRGRKNYQALRKSFFDKLGLPLHPKERRLKKSPRKAEEEERCWSRGRIRTKARRWGCTCRVLRTLGGRGRLMPAEGLGSKRVIWGGAFRLATREGLSLLCADSSSKQVGTYWACLLCKARNMILDCFSHIRIVTAIEKFY